MKTKAVILVFLVLTFVIGIATQYTNTTNDMHEDSIMTRVGAFVASKFSQVITGDNMLAALSIYPKNTGTGKPWKYSETKHPGALNESSWANTSATLPVALGQSQNVVIGDYVYLFGGYAGTNFSNVVYRAPTSNPTSWTSVGTLPSALSQSQSVVIGDYVYLFGGSNSSGRVNVIYRAPTSNPTSWTSVGTLPGTLRSSQVAVIGSYVYLFGGDMTTNVIYRAPISDPTSWTDTGATLPEKLSASQTVVIGNYVYLFGGMNDSGAGSFGAGLGFTQRIYRAPVSDPTSWVNTGKILPGNLGRSQAAVIGDYIYLFGGYNGLEQTSSIYRAPISDPTSWTNTGATLPGNLGMSQLSIIDNYAYLFGGYNDTAYTNVIYRAEISAAPATTVAMDICAASSTANVNGKPWRYSETKNPNTLNEPSWVNTGKTLPSKLGQSQAVIVDDYVYLFGGFNGSSVTNVIYRAPTSDPTTWTNTGKTLPSNIEGSQVAVIDDYVYLFGGYNNSGFFNVIYRAPTSDPTIWTNTGKTLPTTLSYSQVAVIGNYVYLFGGYNNSGSLNVIYRAPTSDPTTWTNTGKTLPGSLIASQVAVIGNYVYLFGGYNDSTNYNKVIYRATISDPTTWTNTGKTLPGNLGFSQTAVIGNYVYLFGGSYLNLFDNKVIYRAPISDPTTWTNTGATLPGNLAMSQLAVIGDYAYLFGGYSDPAYTNVIYRTTIGEAQATTSVPVVQYAGGPYDVTGTTKNNGGYYRTVIIGTQTWFKDNLNAGTMIPAASEQTNNSILEKYCYDNNTTYCDDKGGVYQWNEAMQYSTTEGAQGMCPAGWHIPTDTEYKTLEKSLGMTQAQADVTGWRGTDQGTKLKVDGSSGFEGLLTRYRNTMGWFYAIGWSVHNWSSTASGTDVWTRYMDPDNARVSRDLNQKNNGFSVRCVKN